MNNVLGNNNKQVIVNQIQNERINNITKMANEIINLIHKENKLTDQMALNLQYKIRLMKEELINIKYAIHWAKAGIINSLILSTSEIKLAIDTIEEENLPFASPEEALDFADIKIISNGKSLLYIVYIPLTKFEIFDKLTIKPVKRNNKINEIEYENIIRNHNNIYGIIKQCKTINYLSICNQNNIVDISNSSCLPNLLKSRPSNCNQTNSQHIPTVHEITDGIILLNQFEGDIGLGNESQTLNGTYLIKFSNMSISINNMIFTARDKSTMEVLPAILQPTPKEQKFKETLSLQMMKEINIDNINQIELLQSDKNVHLIISYGLIAVIIGVVITLTFITRSCRNKGVKIINTTHAVETDEQQNSNHELATIEIHPDKSEVQNATIPSATGDRKLTSANQRRKFYDTPFF